MLPPFDLISNCAAAATVATATFADEAGLERLQAQRLSDMLAHAREHSPLYRRLLGTGPGEGETLQSLPVVKKATLMGAFDDWVGDGALRLEALRRFVADPARIAEAFDDCCVVWESSGSTGQPGLYLQDATALAVYDALEGVRRLQLQHPGLAGWSAPSRVAFVGATGGHFASQVSLQRLRRLNPWIASHTTSISFLQGPERLAAELQAWAPLVVATYPSTALVLGQWQRQGRLHLALDEVWTGGETLTRWQRREIEAAFGCRLFNSYGASEFLSLASECCEGGLHLNSDWAVLEPVDAQYRPVPPGQPGHTCLLTNLANRLQPLIRYDLGDRVIFKTRRCRCGSALPLIEVEGRCDDVLQLQGRRGDLVLVSPLAVSTVLEDEAALFDFQLVQQSARDLVLGTAASGKGTDQALERAGDVLRGFLKEQGAAAVHIRCESGYRPRVERSGKVLRVIGPRRGGHAGGTSTAAP
jgi:phenylacetate-coenzyme A ligase PaaK-like adenylate-forming protein